MTSHATCLKRRKKAIVMVRNGGICRQANSSKYYDNQQQNLPFKAGGQIMITINLFQ